MYEQLSNRFSKVEEKIDKLSETVVQLARVEERQTNQTGEISRIHKTLDKHEARIDAVEDVVTERKPIFGILKFIGAGAGGAMLIRMLEKIIT